MYPFHMYSRMHADHLRLSTYRDAIASTVRQGDTVLELGCGPGMFSLMAARQGAARVYALDPSPFAELANRAARTNGLEDRIQVCKCLSTDWTPDRDIHVVLHDLRGTSPIFGRSLHSLRDIRKWIAPHAALIPKRDHLRAALVSCPDLRRDVIDVWSRCDERLLAETYTSLAINSCYTTQITPEMMVSDVCLLGTLDYESDLPLDVALSTTWSVSTTCQVDGVAMWFDSDMTDDIRYTSGPDNPKSVYGQLYFPFRESFTLTTDSQVSWRVNAMDTGPGPLWWWSTQVRLPSGRVVHSRQGEVNVPSLTTEDMRAGTREGSVGRN